jgi:PKD repeat protein
LLRNLLVIIVYLLCTISLQGQSFTNNSGGTIPDNNTLVFFPVNVSGLTTVIDSVNFGLLSVCVSINHTYDANLDIFLRSPDGTIIKLVNNRGSAGKNFTNCCFTENGVIHVGQAIAPFTGNFIPEESLNKVNNLQNPNGVWGLGIIDEVPFYSGSVLNFTIRFGNNPPPTPVISICSISNGRSCKCPDGSQHCELLPDITNSEKIIEKNNIEFNGSLRIGVGTPNIGFGPVEIRGTPNCYCDTVKVPCTTTFCPDGSAPKQQVVQRIYRKDSAAITYTDRPAGFMQYHPAHGHTHLDDWSINSLRLSGPPGSNPQAWPLIGTDKKVSFCLVNSADCNSIPGGCKDKNGNTLLYSDVGNPGLGIISGCGTEQGIYPGYMDIYYPGFDGQDIFFGNICNGWYNIVSVTDPRHFIKETDTSNNTSVVPVYLFQQAGNCCHTNFTADTLIGYAPFKVQFADATMPLSGKWKWNFGDGGSALSGFPSHTYTTPGVYDVTLQTESKDTNCKDSVTKKSLIRVVAKPLTTNPFNVSVYPNPFSKSFTLSFQLSLPKTVIVVCTDITGRTVFKTQVQQAAGRFFEKIFYEENLASGLYFISFYNGMFKQTVKIFKH